VVCALAAAAETLISMTPSRGSARYTRRWRYPVAPEAPKQGDLPAASDGFQGRVVGGLGEARLGQARPILAFGSRTALDRWA
jgi:hypothetical protein